VEVRKLFIWCDNAKYWGKSERMKIEDIKLIGVVGAGLMGSGISQTALFAGYKVILRDLTDEILKRAMDTIVNGRFGFKGAIERGKLTQDMADEALTRFDLTTKVEDLKDCDIVIEAVGGTYAGEMENKPLKLRVFTELDKIVKTQAILASNTGRFTIADLAAVTERKDKFIGMHWFSPAFIMKAIEIVWTTNTSEETIQTIEDLCNRLGKIGVRVKDIPGDTAHAGLRVFGAAAREAKAIVEEGIVSTEGIDTIMMGGFGWPNGPMGMGRSVRSGWDQKSSV
jgi:3-hydroxybutyryl-CoA dehydrogenase